MHMDAVVEVVFEQTGVSVLRYSLAASKSPEAINVVSAASGGILTASSRALVAPLHVLKHLSATSVTELVGRPAEVGGEESAEGGDRESTSGCAHDLIGVRRSEQELSVHLETLDIRVGELTDGHAIDTLEGMAWDHGAVSVI